MCKLFDSGSQMTFLIENLHLKSLKEDGRYMIRGSLKRTLLRRRVIV